MAIMGFHWRFWVVVGDNGFPLAIVGLPWPFWDFIVYYGFSLTIMGLLVIVCFQSNYGIS